MITFIISMWNNVPICIDSLLEQKDPNWRAIVVHDGPCASGYKPNDPRISFYETPERKNDTGDSTKVFGLTKLTDADLLICYTNADNYYTPGFVRHIRPAFAEHDIVAAYCNCLHNYFNWELMITHPGFTQIDCGCFVVRGKIAREVGWPSTGPASDWGMIAPIVTLYPNRIKKVNMNLFVHN